MVAMEGFSRRGRSGDGFRSKRRSRGEPGHFSKCFGCRLLTVLSNNSYAALFQVLQENLEAARYPCLRNTSEPPLCVVVLQCSA